MKAQAPSPENAVGGDSFLDIVSNMVGIVIILVIVAGLRVKHSAVESTDVSEEIAALESDIARYAAQAKSLEADTNKLALQSQELEMLAELRNEERDALSAAVALHQKQLERRRSTLEAESQAAFDLQQAVRLARAELDEVERQKSIVQQVGEAPIVEVKTYPTPISQTVYGREAHFQLQGGRITPIPLDELLDRFKREAREKVYKLRDAPVISETIGPVGGFRLRYKLERVDVPVGAAAPGSAVQVGSYARLYEYTLLPVRPDMGETHDEAMRSTSDFRSALVGLNPRDTTVTLWTYPDSFSLYRQVKAELYKQGFAVAGRPLPEGQSIGGSPDGTKSAAQ